MIILKTDRLFLRTWETTDLQLAQELWGNSKVMTFIDTRGGLTEEQVIAKLDLEIECQLKNGLQYWPIFEQQTQDFVGCCGLKPWVHSDRGGFELGFHIIQEKWGRGYALEVAKGVISYAFTQRKLSHLMAGHHPDNLNAKKILLQLGFQFVEKVFFKPTGLMHSSYHLGTGPL